MNNTSPLVKITAVTFSVVLAAGFIRDRAGGFDDTKAFCAAIRRPRCQNMSSHQVSRGRIGLSSTGANTPRSFKIRG